MDSATGWCLGCGRTREELVSWGTQPPQVRDAVWHALPARLDTLGVSLRRPDWDEDAIRRTLKERLNGCGEWRICECGGFSAVTLCAPEVTVDGSILTARDERQAVRLKVDRHLRGFLHPDADAAAALLLGVLRLRLPETRSASLTEVGPDRKAILDADAGGILFDLGLGFPPARFMLRTEDAALQRLLRDLDGAQLSDVIAEAGYAMDAAQPTRVTQSAGARIETAMPVLPAAGGFAALLTALRHRLSDAPAPLDIGEAHGPVAVHRTPAAAPH